MNYLCLVDLGQDKLHACPDSVCLPMARSCWKAVTTLLPRRRNPSTPQPPFAYWAFAETKEQMAGYSHGFHHLDGHGWELMYMDMDALPKT